MARAKGIEFLRNIYSASGFCIRPRPRAEVYDVIEEIARSKGYEVNKEMLRMVISQPHRSMVTSEEWEERRRTMLR